MTRHELFEMQQTLAHTSGNMMAMIENVLDHLPDDFNLSGRRNLTRQQIVSEINNDFQKLCDLSQTMLAKVQELKN